MSSLSINLRENLLTRPELAASLGISERSVWRYERRPGGIPSILLGGRKYYDIADVKAWLERSKQTKADNARDPRRFLKSKRRG